jgi:hypothetical protein
MKEVAKEHEVIFEHYGDSAEVLKTSSKMPLDLLGKQNPDTNFMGCYHANDRCFLSKGRLFPCTIAPNVWKFNKFFNQNLSISDEDYIDIYKAINEKEILNFLSKPIPFCKYCYVEKRTFGLPWKRSRKDIKEWIV